MSIHDVISWALPLTETNILNKSKIVPEVYKILSGQRLSKYISDMPISRDILEIHFSLLHYVMNELIIDLDALQIVMENWIIYQLNTALIVTIYHSRF